MKLFDENSIIKKILSYIVNRIEKIIPIFIEKNIFENDPQNIHKTFMKTF